LGCGVIDKEGIRQQDLDQKLMGGDWEQKLRERGENQEIGLGGGLRFEQREGQDLR
jgi:hypothetical protein